MNYYIGDFDSIDEIPKEMYVDGYVATINGVIYECKSYWNERYKEDDRDGR